MAKGTIAIEEAVIDPSDLQWLGDSASMYAPAAIVTGSSSSIAHALTQKLADIHIHRLAQMDAEGVEYMLLSVTSPGPQGEPDRAKAQQMAVSANNWLAGEVKKNPKRFGALASLSMHDAAEAAAELRRAVKELGMFGAILNDYQSTSANGSGKKYFDEEEYRTFWKTVQELDVPVYMHPRYPCNPELEKGAKYGDRKHLVGAAVQFHLDLSFHLYALMSSGVFDEFPKVQVVCGHLGEG